MVDLKKRASIESNHAALPAAESAADHNRCGNLDYAERPTDAEMGGGDAARHLARTAAERGLVTVDGAAVSSDAEGPISPPARSAPTLPAVTGAAAAAVLRNCVATGMRASGDPAAGWLLDAHRHRHGAAVAAATAAAVNVPHHASTPSLNGVVWAGVVCCGGSSVRAIHTGGGRAASAAAEAAVDSVDVVMGDVPAAPGVDSGAAKAVDTPTDGLNTAVGVGQCDASPPPPSSTKPSTPPSNFSSPVDILDLSLPFCAVISQGEYGVMTGVRHYCGPAHTAASAAAVQ